MVQRLERAAGRPVDLVAAGVILEGCWAALAAVQAADLVAQGQERAAARRAATAVVQSGVGAREATAEGR